jgi:amino acid transporter
VITLQVPPEKFSKVNWGLFLTTIVWSTGGFDNMSQVSSELQNPKKSYPRAMVLTLFAMIITTIVPFLVAFSVAPNYHLWHDGYWAQIAFLAAGDWLRIVLVVGAIISSLSILNAYLCTCSEMLAAWGEPGTKSQHHLVHPFRSLTGCV